MPPRKEHPAWKFTTARETAMPRGKANAKQELLEHQEQIDACTMREGEAENV